MKCSIGASQVTSTPSACDSPPIRRSIEGGRFTKGSASSCQCGMRPTSAKKRPPLTVRFQGSAVVTTAASSMSKPSSLVPLIVAKPRRKGSIGAEMKSSPLRSAKFQPA